MTISLRRRPVCYYCGKRNNPVNAQKYKCKHCLADNFLDENGEIVDVPPDITQATEQFAIPLEPFDSSGSIFCQTCLKNQYMYTDAMSHFLPEFDHPEYPQYEAALPEFKRRMQQQYPQCCAICEPKVQAQLQQATYHARSDHLRRVLDRSRGINIAKTFGWRSLIVNGAGLGYLVSLFIQLVWHVMGSQATRMAVPDMRPTECLTRRPAAQCPDLIEQFMGMSLLLGTVTGWWNPKWQHKLKGRQGRLVGLSGYYRAQIVVLVVRFVAWVAIRDVPALEQHASMLHSLSLVLIILIAGYTNLSIIKVDTTPLVDWQQKQTPLLTSGQFEPQPQPVQQAPQGANLLQKLYSTQPQLEAWRPPTPPSDDVMDWAPSSANFAPQPKQILYKSTQPSPFVGTLPALPKQGIFASRTTNQPEPAKAIGIPQGFFDKRHKLREAKSSDQMFAQPKFFTNDSDTGLENIFGKVFSLDEDTVEVRNQPKIAGRNVFKSPPRDMLGQICLRTITVIILGTMTGYTTTKSYLGVSVDQKIIIYATTIPALNATLGLIKVVNSSRSVLNLACGVVLAALTFTCPGEQSLLSPLWNKLVIGTISMLLLQEIHLLCTIPLMEQKRDISRLPMNKQHVNIQPASNAWNLPDVRRGPAMVEPITPRVSRSRRDSIDSISSNSSLASTSTSSTWKTPKINSRMTGSIEPLATNTRTTRSSGFGVGSLGLEDFTIGSTVAGPRNRPKRGQAW